MVGKKVAVVILNYKVKEDILECVASVKKSNYKNSEIIVVDNNSRDGLKVELTKLDDVTFIQTGDNLGYCGGNNIGIRKALESKADFLFILNPDTKIKIDTISNLVKLANETGHGIYGPKILFGDRKTIWYGGGIIDTDNVLGVHIGMDEVDKGQYDKVTETGFVSGAAIFIRRDVFGSIGLFNEKYFLYLEDMEFCWRAKTKGIKSAYNPKAVVYHKNAKSTGLGSSLQDYFITRNRLLFAFKYLSWGKRLVLLKHVFLTMNFSTRRQAMFDFLTGKFGKGSYIHD